MVVFQSAALGLDRDLAAVVFFCVVIGVVGTKTAGFVGVGTTAAAGFTDPPPVAVLHAESTNQSASSFRPAISLADG
jgi:hypothetical protein